LVLDPDSIKPFYTHQHIELPEIKFRAFDRVAHTDHPIFCIQHIFEVAIGFTCKFERTGFVDPLQSLYELTTEDPWHMLAFGAVSITAGMIGIAKLFFHNEVLKVIERL
jgi:hypothetical protein